MKKLQTILVASDLSDHAQRAVQRAAQLAREHQSRVELLHVLESWSGEAPPPDFPTEALMQQETLQARETLQHQVEAVAAQDLRPALRIEVGKDFVAIIRRARQINADLIVVGAHGSHSVRDLFLGTTAEKVVRKGERPVLVVKKPAPGPYQRVLVPTDFSDASRQALHTALGLAPGARLDLLHVYRLWGIGRLNLPALGDAHLQGYHAHLLESAKHQMKEYLRDVKPGTRRLHRHMHHGHPSILIPAQATELGADLVALGTEGLSSLPYLLLGSVAEHVMRHADCDVLAVRPTAFSFELP